MARITTEVDVDVDLDSFDLDDILEEIDDDANHVNMTKEGNRYLAKLF
jgi:hypothetical protein